MDWDGEWLESWLSPERFQPFLQHANGDRGLARALVHWDGDLLTALFRDLGRWEIALRNAYDRSFSDRYQGPAHWLFDPRSPVVQPLVRRKIDLNERSRHELRKAIARTNRPNPTPGEVIRELSLGFWRVLTTTAREKTIWVPILHHAFPRGADRVAVDRLIGGLHAVRNRVAHHRPAFTQPIPAVAGDLIRCCELIRPELAYEMRERNSIMQVWYRRPSVRP